MAVLAALTAVALTTGGGSSARAGEAAASGDARPAGASPAPAVTRASSAPRTGAVVPEAPSRVVLPSGAELSVVPVGTTRGGALDVPGDVRTAGWWRGGSRIGDPFGSVLVAAHVDSATVGLGPSVELLGVRRGQEVELRSRHLRQAYAITSLRLLDKDALADQPWIHAATGPHRLVMVTCAGPYDATRGGYQRLAVVTASPVGGPAARSGDGAG